MTEVDRAIRLYRHVKNGWIAKGVELYNPNDYKIVPIDLTAESISGALTKDCSRLVESLELLIKMAEPPNQEEDRAPDTVNGIDA